MRKAWRITAAGAMVLASFSLLASVYLYTNVRDVQRTGRDQSCVLFERQYRSAVDRINRTYAYVEKLTPRERRTAINRAVIQQIPQTEQDAHQARPPRYCDPSDVGLPGPHPRIPPRP